MEGGEEMLRILFITNTVSLYGANRSAIELAMGLQKLGLQIIFFFPESGTIEQKYTMKRLMKKYGFLYFFLNYFPGVHIKQEKGMFPRVFRAEGNKLCLDSMKKIAKQCKVDIIHTNSLTHTIGAKLSWKIHKPHVWHIREALHNHYDFEYDNIFLYRYGLRRSEQIICISNYIKKTYKHMLVGAQTAALYDGVDIEQYILSGTYKKYKDKYCILICGLICKEKGQLEAVKAIGCLVYKYNIKNVQLQIVGDGYDSYYKRLIDYIRQNNLTDFIEILPFQENLKELRKNADIVLMCSRNEALGRVSIESMLGETVVIGGNSAGTAEVIQDGENGYLYELGNVLDLCEKIYYVIMNWEEQEKIIENAKKYVKANYDMNEYAKKIYDIYMKLV